MMAMYLDLDDAVANVTGDVAKRELDELRRQRSELVEALRRIEQRHGAVESLGSRIIAEQTLANLDRESASSKPSDVTTWRGAVDHELICTQTATAETYDHDPLQGVRHLIQWHIDTDRYFREQPAVPEGWRNMESAPVDGTQILLRCPTDDATLSVLGLYAGDQWIGAFWTGIDWARGILSPDGWLPIPEPPKGGRE